MRVFVTGASGWIGSHTVPHLLAAGHDVVGLARSDASTRRIEELGATAVRGGLDDPSVLRAAARDADAVVHLAFKHDFTDYEGAGRTERAVVQGFLDELADSGRALLLASGLAGKPGQVITEDDPTAFTGPEAPRGGSDGLVLAAGERGVAGVALRFAASVHGAGDHGFVDILARTARERGVSGYVGDGTHRWPAVHVSDAGRAVALAVDKATTGGTAAHVVAEEGIATRDIAAAIGDALGLPVASVDPADAMDHFGWLGGFWSTDIVASSERTRERLGWVPTGPTLLEDLAAGAYDHVARG
ncbi:NAD-dependent epimerase/dehydratase family protein [Isoptericola sp. F-RaC21]|uniref:NAD-dependent epimerase/dehydratase family protein n=1 Tax=Isoptericola sp. F-RaC21 TaxID=3141452 RepID=UPI00315B9E88